MFHIFHLEGEKIDIYQKLNSANISFLAHVITPNYNGNNNAMDLAIKDEDIKKFFDVLISWNQQLRKAHQKEIKILNKNWNEGITNELKYGFFTEFHLESKKIMIFGDLSKEKIEYLPIFRCHCFNKNNVAINLLIKKEDIFSVLKIIYEKNRQSNEEAIIIYQKEENQWLPIPIKETLTNMLLEKEENQKIVEDVSFQWSLVKNQSYLIPYGNDLRIYYNSNTDFIRVYEVGKKNNQRIQFFRNNPTNDFEERIVKMINRFLENISPQPTKKIIKEA